MNEPQRTDPSTPPQPISMGRLNWLREQVGQWAYQQVIDDQAAAAILAGYESEDKVHQRRKKKVFMALCGLAVLMFAAGVLLLIGYNWSEIPRFVKVGMVFASVACAFVGSFYCYSKDRPIAGEIFALLGTLLFGCAIWLLAQIFHIRAHYPNGVMWWMIGTLLIAHLVRSKMIGGAAIILLYIWAMMELGDFSNPAYLFISFAAAAVWLAYRLDSFVLLGMGVLASALWMLVASVQPWGLEETTAPIMVLLGTACYSAGLIHGTHSPFGRTWHILGLGAILAALVPLTFTEFYERWSFDEYAMIVSLIAGGVLLLVTICGFVVRRTTAMREDWPVLVTAVFASALPTVAITADLIYTEVQLRLSDDWFQWTGAIIFNIVAAVLAIWLIMRGVRLDRALSFFIGIIYMLILVMVRWFDLIDDMLGSSVIFFIGAAVLFATAWYWHKRHAPDTPASQILEGASHVE